MFAIRQHEFGGPDQLLYEELADPVPGSSQVRIVMAARAYAEDALDLLAAGLLLPRVHPPLRLAHAGDAHRALESRATTGKVVRVP